jgi:hypothetical protein
MAAAPFVELFFSFSSKNPFICLLFFLTRNHHSGEVFENKTFVKGDCETGIFFLQRYCLQLVMNSVT